MATITATKNGDWSDTTVWDLGRAPTNNDLVQAVSYVIQLDVDINQPDTEINATTGYYNYGGTATRDVVVKSNPGTHVGNYIINNASSGTLHVTGLIVGGIGSNAFGANNAAAGTLTVTTATGGSGTYTHGANNASDGTVTVTTATGGSGIAAHGANNAAAGTLTVTTATGGSGYAAHGANNAAAGTVTVRLAVGNDYGPGGTHANSCAGVAANNTTGQVTRVYATRYGPHGQPPVSGPVLMVADATNQSTFATDYVGGTRTLTPSGATADFPAVGNVRHGTSYDNGDKVGTCYVPTAANVALGVDVDDTTGTAVLTAAGVRAAVGMALANLDTQLSAVRAAIVPPPIVL